MKHQIPQFEGQHILVIGDVMLDRYWHGQTKRISPEAPVPIMHVKNCDERPGGAANVALNIKALGAKVTLAGIVGNDALATTLQTKLAAAGVDFHFYTSSDQPTISKLRVISHNQQLIRLDFEESLHGDAQQLLPAIEQQITASDLVILSDYGKGIAAIAPQIIALAKQYNKPVIVDPKGNDFSIYTGATVITPNLKEFELIVGACANEDELGTKGQQLLQRLQLNNLLITRGPQGMTLINQSGDIYHSPTKAQEVFDVTGAGDTVVATLAATLAAGTNMLEAVEIANIAAGISVKKFGSAIVTVPELRRALRKLNDSWLGIVSEEQLLQEIDDAKAHGETIVMTNGCFDLLHAGHIAYLEQAKALGHRLIVAINDDDSVKRLKGPNRPINNLTSRMEVVAGLRPVDWVVSFSEDTPQRLIEAVSPHILVKGGDYKPEEIAGADHVVANGGVVKILTFIANHSSSNIINKIQQEEK